MQSACGADFPREGQLLLRPCARREVHAHGRVCLRLLLRDAVNHTALRVEIPHVYAGHRPPRIERLHDAKRSRVVRVIVCRHEHDRVADVEVHVGTFVAEIGAVGRDHVVCREREQYKIIRHAVDVGGVLERRDVRRRQIPIREVGIAHCDDGTVRGEHREAVNVHVGEIPIASQAIQPDELGDAQVFGEHGLHLRLRDARIAIRIQEGTARGHHHAVAIHFDRAAFEHRRTQVNAGHRERSCHPAGHGVVFRVGGFTTPAVETPIADLQIGVGVVGEHGAVVAYPAVIRLAHKEIDIGERHYRRVQESRDARLLRGVVGNDVDSLARHQRLRHCHPSRIQPIPIRRAVCVSVRPLEPSALVRGLRARHAPENRLRLRTCRSRHNGERGKCSNHRRDRELLRGEI